MGANLGNVGRSSTARRLALGHLGEELAAGWYIQRGYELIARNWRCRLGEIDIVARKAGLTVFCEVKARSSERFGSPAEAVGLTKQLRARRLAAAWFASMPEGPRARGGPVRFDVACVLAGDLEVIESAF